jgi:hypothetical protein
MQTRPPPPRKKMRYMNHTKTGVISDAPKLYVVPTPVVAPVVLLLSQSGGKAWMGKDPEHIRGYFWLNYNIW